MILVLYGISIINLYAKVDTALSITHQTTHLKTLLYISEWIKEGLLRGYASMV
jgi:hypothetical protein